MPFDPFNDRKSREVRNTLSRSFMDALDEGRTEAFESAASALMARNPHPAYRSYVEDRLRRYRQSLAEITAKRLSDPFFQALVLWNHGLFFEAHERLEAVWRHSSGQYGAALKGLIQAAGVFMHREQGRTNSAERLSAKAGDLIEKHGHLLPVDLRELRRALRTDGAKAPRLEPLPPGPY